MRRRDVVTLAAGAAAWPFARLLAAEAQRPVGALINGADNPRSQSVLGAFREGLATFGWVEGRNLRIDYRFSDDPSRLSVCGGTGEPATRRDFCAQRAGSPGVQQRTPVIPIVFVGGGDPASNGMVRNIARPEGNMTGFANIFGSLGGRWLQLFKEAVPRLTRVADIFFVSELSVRNELRATIPAAAAQLGVTIIRMPVRNEVEVEQVISAFAAEPNGGLLLTGVNPDPILEAIGRLALYYHLPLMYGANAGVTIRREGMLMAHGPDPLDLTRRASSYVDRILRGAKPGELPVQYPTKFELVVNLKTAKAIGVTIPETFLVRADEVIE